MDASGDRKIAAMAAVITAEPDDPGHVCRDVDVLTHASRWDDVDTEPGRCPRCGRELSRG